jgi:hypothetical protein
VAVYGEAQLSVEEKVQMESVVALVKIVDGRKEFDDSLDL